MTEVAQKTLEISAAVLNDARPNYFEDKVLALLKLKNEKWKKMMAVPENM